jgi:hypothetical protein
MMQNGTVRRTRVNSRSGRRYREETGDGYQENQLTPALFRTPLTLQIGSNNLYVQSVASALAVSLNEQTFLFETRNLDL